MSVRKSTRVSKRRLVYETEDDYQTSKRTKSNSNVHSGRKVVRKNKDLSTESNSDDSDTDPEKLWCICRKPHGNRFMICCDLCDEWYHGDCVGIKPGDGKRMERQKIEFVCASCQSMSDYRKGNSFDESITETLNASSIATAATTTSSYTSELTTSIVNSLRLQLDQEAKKDSDQCASVCPLTEQNGHATTNVQLSKKETKTAHLCTSDSNQSTDATTQKRKVKLRPKGLKYKKRNSSVNPRTLTKITKRKLINSCLALNCSKTVNPQVSLYCSMKCLKAYAFNVIKGDANNEFQIKNDTETENHKPLVVLDRRSGMVLNDSRAPIPNNLVRFLSAHRTFQVISDRYGSVESSPSNEPKQFDELEKTESTTQQGHDASLPDADSPPSTLSSTVTVDNLTSVATKGVDHHQQVDLCRKKYRKLVFGLFEKRIQTSRHLFTTNRIQLRTLAHELEAIVAAKNNLVVFGDSLSSSPHSSATAAAALSKQRDLSQYETQLSLFTTYLDVKQSSKLKLSNWVCDQFFHLLLTGHLKPIDLAQCTTSQALIGHIERAQANERSGLGALKNRHAVADPLLGTEQSKCELRDSTTVSTSKSNPIDTTFEHGKHLYDMNCQLCNKPPKVSLRSKATSKVDVKTEAACLSKQTSDTSPIGVSSVVDDDNALTCIPHVKEEMNSASITFKCESKSHLSGAHGSNYFGDEKMKNTTSLLNTTMPNALTKNKHIPPSSVIKHEYTAPTSNHSRLISTGLLDLPLPPPPPSSYDGSNDDGRDVVYSSTSCELLVSTKSSARTSFNPPDCFWTGSVCLAVESHKLVVSTRAFRFGYIRPKFNQLATIGPYLNPWSSLDRFQLNASLNVKSGVNLHSLPVYLSQSLLNDSDPRILFALYLQLSNLSSYQQMYDHLLQTNACGVLHPQPNGFHNFFLYPLKSKMDVANCLIPHSLVGQFDVNFDQHPLATNHDCCLIILITKSIGQQPQRHLTPVEGIPSPSVQLAASTDPRLVPIRDAPTDVAQSSPSSWHISPVGDVDYRITTMDDGEPNAPGSRDCASRSIGYQDAYSGPLNRPALLPTPSVRKPMGYNCSYSRRRQDDDYRHAYSTIYDSYRY